VLIYGPLSFTAGVMLTLGHSWWWGVLPAMWFVGVSLSHIVFGRCVLNVVVTKMRKFNKGSAAKAHTYMRRGTMAWAKSYHKTKAVRETINDTMNSPDMTSQPTETTKI
jgi:hypothetical protein